jgi:hypothetical protein
MRFQILMTALVAILVSKPTATLAQEQNQILCTSPSGMLRVENRSKDAADIWVVSAKDPTQQAKLPLESPRYIPDEFQFSPNEEWIFALWMAATQHGELFRRKSALEIEKFDSGKSFYELAWAESTRLGAVPLEYWGDQMSFGCWSMDSSRLLVKLEWEVKKVAHQLRTSM